MTPAVGMPIIYDTLTAKHEGTIVGVLDANSDPAVVVIEVGEQKGRTYFYPSLQALTDDNIVGNGCYPRSIK